MCGEILHIYGPLSIRGFGLMIVIGLVLVTFLIVRSPARKKIMTTDCFIDALWFCVMVGIIGGRIAFALSEWATFDYWWEIFAVWEGGFSLLGSIIGVLLVVPWYLRVHHVPILPFLDLIASHALLLQSIARIGCFLAGCCYGMQTNLPWGVRDYMQTPDLCLHPTQLYSAGLLLLLYFLLRFLAPRVAHLPGQTIMLYLVCASSERFVVDFVRGDREYFHVSWLACLSAHQWISLLLFSGGLIGFFLLSNRARLHHA